MICTKIVSSFFIIEINGSAIDTVIQNFYGINKITFGSINFENDLDATSKMKSCIENITSKLDLTDVEEHSEFNSEFYPSAANPAPNISDNIVELEDKNKVMIVVTRNFDELGDNIQSKLTIKSKDFQILGKVGMHVDDYLRFKAEQHASTIDIESELLMQ